MTPRLRALLAPPPTLPIEALPPSALRAKYDYWRWRQFGVTFLGYTVFYFVRTNLPIAMPLMESQLGLSKLQLGTLKTVGDLAYGVSKFANGIVADRTNPRVLMALGLLLSAAMNALFGLGAGFATFFTIWLLNGWFQGMGYPACARVLSHWIPPKQRGTLWGVWNASHQIGAAMILVIGGALGRAYGWQAPFVVPALVAVVVSLVLATWLRDTPGSVGLPPVEHFDGEVPGGPATPPILTDAEREEAARVLRREVFRNKYIWLASIGNFFVYVVRYGLMTWAPTYLNQVKHVPLHYAGGMTAGLEVAGIFGAFLAGWISDRRLLRCRRAPVCAVYMVLLTVGITVFWRLPALGMVFDATMLVIMGFLVYGPQFLVGVMAADLAGKEAAATAVGITGLLGYASAVVTGSGLGWVLGRYGWSGGFGMLIGCAVLGTIPFVLAWNAVPRVEPDAGGVVE